MNRSVRLKILDLDCPDCAARLEGSIARLEGVDKCELDFTSATAKIAFDDRFLDKDRLAKKIAGLGHKTVFEARTDTVARKSAEKAGPSFRDIMLVIAIFAMFAVSIFHESPYLRIIFSLTAIITGGLFIFRAAFYSLKNLSADMNLLMSIAVVGAMIIGEWSEAAVTIVLFSIANYLEGRSVRKAHTAFRSLSEKNPSAVEVETENGLKKVDPGNLVVGDIIHLRPGMTSPTDCEIIEGKAFVNHAAISGESQPVSLGPGDNLLGGVINTDGFLRARVLKPYSDSTLSRIIRMVEEASARKSRLAAVVDRFAKVYTPIMVLIAGLVFLVPVLIFKQDLHTWFYRALVLLVISCPCALVISTPVAVLCGLTRAARNGILIKGGIFLEKLAGVKKILFDKTGTLTSGKFRVAEILPMNDHSRENLLAAASAIERYSEHPMALAISEYAIEKKIEIPESLDFRAYPGEGASASVGGEIYTVGSHRFFHDNNVCDLDNHRQVQELEDRGFSLVLISKGNILMGVIALADLPKPETSETISDLKKMGLEDIIMLTGDNEKTACAVAESIGIKNIRSGLLPHEKNDIVTEYRRDSGAVAMVGDGINDAPALASADVGIAMGTGGSDIAIEAADVAVIGDNLGMLPRAIRLARRAFGIIKFNIAFAIIIKFAFMVLAGIGLASLWMAVFADMGTSLIVIFNSLRLLRE